MRGMTHDDYPGTVFYDSMLGRSASYMVHGPPEDTQVVKQVYRAGRIYSVDMATGRCVWRHVANESLRMLCGASKCACFTLLSK